MVNDLSCDNGIRMWAQLYFIFSQITRSTDRQTDRQTDIQLAFSWLDRVACSARSAVNTTYEYRNIRVTATVFSATTQ